MDDPVYANEVLQKIANGPDSQIDASLKTALEALIANPTPPASDMHAILDDIVFGGLASDFVVSVLDGIWKEMLKKEGKTVQQALIEKHGLP